MTPLHIYLRINAVFSALSGLTMLLANGPLQAWFGFELAWVFPVIGLSLLGFSASIFLLLRKDPLPLKEVRLISIMDGLWVLGSGLIILLPIFPISQLGYYLIGGVALLVGFLGWKQMQHLPAAT
ncbi:MAG: hypothetical protein AAFR61_09125 [Bacteroidota bacterium]